MPGGFRLFKVGPEFGLNRLFRQVVSPSERKNMGLPKSPSMESRVLSTTLELAQGRQRPPKMSRRSPPAQRLTRR